LNREKRSNGVPPPAGDAGLRLPAAGGEGGDSAIVSRIGIVDLAKRAPGDAQTEISFQRTAGSFDAAPGRISNVSLACVARRNRDKMCVRRRPA
jgi:hypothetical protein